MNYKSSSSFIIGAIFGASGAVLAKALYEYWRRRNKINELNVSLSGFWPFTQINFVQEVHVISCNEDLKTLLPRIRKEVNEVCVLGFDCEWTSYGHHSNKVALLQLATYSGLCLLIRLCKFNEPLLQKIKTILESKDVFKVGVGCYDDGNKLMNDYGVVLRGCLDLRSFATRFKLAEPLGLQKLSKEFLNINLDKSFKIRCSDWECAELSQRQIDYAANDALCAIQIFQVFLRRNFTTSSRNNNITKILQATIQSYVKSASQGITDVKFKQAKNNFKSINGKKCDKKLQNLTLKDPKNYKPMKKHSTRQNPLYDNCKLEAPDGQLLSTCDRKKVKWYLAKQLAEVVCDEPYTVRLFFEPSGRPDDDRDYYLYDKENKCVVCAATEFLVRKNIIPHEYRKHFPVCMKDHVSHDILLLCLSCHQRTNYHDCMLRRRIEEEYDAPMGSMQTVRLLEKPERRLVRSAARAILKAGDKLPEERRNYFLQVIKEYFQVEQVNDSLIQQASDLETRVKNECYTPHGEKVVKVIREKDDVKGLLAFEIRWREHFLNTMQPKFMPHLWSLDHNHDKALRRLVNE